MMIRDAKLKWLFAVVMLALPAAAAQAEITIDTVAVGNTSNSADSTTSYGAVDYNYNIGQYEVTAGQYRDFLNAVDPTGANAYDLYNSSMDSNPYGCQITLRSGAVNGSKYDFSGAPSGTASDWANRPVNYVSFWDAARFANWLHNGQGSGSTETGAYRDIGNQSDFARNPGATWFIPTEDEWYKAAYYDPAKPGGAGYWDYPTMSDLGNPPSNDLSDPDLGNNATFYQSDYTIGSDYYRTEVGAHENSASAYGTFDQGGNVREWNETVLYDSYRGYRGGSFALSEYNLRASTRYYIYPTNEYTYVGFRVASSAAIPEPGSVAMLAGLAVMGLIWWRRRR